MSEEAAVEAPPAEAPPAEAASPAGDEVKIPKIKVNTLFKKIIVNKQQIHFLIFIGWRQSKRTISTPHKLLIVSF